MFAQQTWCLLVAYIYYFNNDMLLVVSLSHMMTQKSALSTIEMASLTVGYAYHYYIIIYCSYSCLFFLISFSSVMMAGLIVGHAHQFLFFQLRFLLHYDMLLYFSSISMMMASLIVGYAFLCCFSLLSLPLSFPLFILFMLFIIYVKLFLLQYILCM